MSTEQVLPLHLYEVRAQQPEDVRLPAELLLICQGCGLELTRWTAGRIPLHVILQTIRAHHDSAHPVAVHR